VYKTFGINSIHMHLRINSK